MESCKSITLCDIPWWEKLESDEKRNEYCKNTFGISYNEYLQIIDSDLPINEMYKQILEKHSE